jgi:hypothetical protein
MAELLKDQMVKGIGLKLNVFIKTVHILEMMNAKRLVL